MVSIRYLWLVCEATPVNWTPLAEVMSTNLPGTIGRFDAGGGAIASVAGATCAEEFQPQNNMSAQGAKPRRECAYKPVIRRSQSWASWRRSGQVEVNASMGALLLPHRTRIPARQLRCLGRGMADHEPRLDHMFPLERGYARHFVAAAKKTAKRGCRQLAARNMQRRQPRLDVGAEFDIVEADDGNILRNAQTRLMDGAHRADRRQIVRRQHRGRMHSRTQYPLHRGMSAFDTMIAFLHQMRFTRQFVLSQRFREGLCPDLRRTQRQRPADTRNALVAEREEVLHGELHTGCVIDAHSIHAFHLPWSVHE